MEELLQGTRSKLDGQAAQNHVFAHPLPFNVIPHIDKFQVGGYCQYVLYAEFSKTGILFVI